MQIRDINTAYGQGKTTSLHYTAILGATLHKENIWKEWERSGKNVLVLRQVKSIIKKGWSYDLEILEIHQKK